MKHDYIEAYKAIDEVEHRILKEIRKDPDVRLDPHWCPESACVTELGQVLARSYMNKTALDRARGCIGEIENIHSLIIEQTRWFRERGYKYPEEISNIEDLRVDYCGAGSVLQSCLRVIERDEEDSKLGYMADLSMGVCHLIAQEFYGGDDALFQDL